MADLICICCPQGCHLSVDTDGKEYHISGFRCPRGKNYAVSEVTDPRRIVTAVIPVNDPHNPTIAIRTTAPCPKAMIPGLLNRLYRKKIKMPVKNGDIIWKNVDNSGISVIVTENI